MTTTPLTADERAELRRLCDEWIAYADRFGIVAEIHNGAITEQHCRTVVSATTRLLDMLDSVERERDAMIADLDGWAYSTANNVVARANEERDSFCAQLATVKKERDNAITRARGDIHSVQGHVVNMRNEWQRCEAQLATAAAKLAAYEQFTAGCTSNRCAISGRCAYPTACRLVALPATSKEAPDGE